ncbi:hypothetical protein TNIN_491701 [Trichonephila inaurata madagascariensis]|uniref:Uncharacterized protein n=1 Tax=Trichonephila inaurata madagascariensis TaxID=2747483 RepID=A0A8X6IUF7_9ARAC|nr:hypothetical protein TNIN_491701 [Trichonephila inaurata madagascariensis]
MLIRFSNLITKPLTIITTQKGLKLYSRRTENNSIKSFDDSSKFNDRRPKGCRDVISSRNDLLNPPPCLPFLSSLRHLNFERQGGLLRQITSTLGERQ